MIAIILGRSGGHGGPEERVRIGLAVAILDGQGVVTGDDDGGADPLGRHSGPSGMHRGPQLAGVLRGVAGDLGGEDLGSFLDGFGQRSLGDPGSKAPECRVG